MLKQPAFRAMAMSVSGLSPTTQHASSGWPDLSKANSKRWVLGFPNMILGFSLEQASSPETMADYAIKSYEAGARIIGGCCGSTPEHITAISGALTNYPKR